MRLVNWSIAIVILGFYFALWAVVIYSEMGLL